MNSDHARPPRLTRAETKARTRALLLDAGAQVFARRGFAGASVEGIAETAGFSIGALYSNFAGKEELFLELLSTRQDGRLAEAAQIVADEDSSLEHRRVALGQLLVSVADKDVDLAPLQAEFWLYAVRRPELLELLSTQFRATRDTLSDVLAARAQQRGTAGGPPPEAVATVVLALFQGLVQLRRTDPANVPEELYASAIQWLFTGISTLARDSA